MGMIKTENLITYKDPERNIITAKGFSGRVKYSENWEIIPGYEKLRFRTWQFEDVDASIKDGAQIEIQPGGRTPVQFVKSENTFYETFIKGKLLFLMVSPEGKLFVDSFDSSVHKVSYTLEVPKGYLMCWLSSNNQENPAEVLEYEEPGFSTVELPTVPDDALIFEGQTIPQEFWDIIHKFESGIDPEEFNSLTEVASNS